MKNRRIAILPLLALGLLAAWSAPADAQRRGRGRVVVRPSVVFIGGYGYPRYYYDPFFDYGYPYYGQYGYPYGPFGGLYPPYGYGSYDRRDQLTASVRLEVTPDDAQVFVDGYAAGQVDDFDGIFQRLRVHPGSHEITLYRDGYKTVRQNLYLSPGSDQKIKYTLEKLAAGETSELPPQPSETAQQAPPPDDRPMPRGPVGQPGPRRPMPPPSSPESSSRFGTLSVRVQPGDAEVLVDGERWNAPQDQDRIAVQLSEGRHHVEIRKAGFSTYAEDVLIRSNNTLTLNVSLLRGDANSR